MLCNGPQRLLGVELAAQHERGGEREPEREVRKAPRVKHRRRDHRRLARLQRDLREQGRRRLQRVRLRARRTLGRTRRARREDHHPPALGGSAQIGVIAAGDQLFEQRLGRTRAGLTPGDEALAAPAGLLYQLRELLVVDQCHGVFARDHVGDLRAGEVGVEVQRARPQLRAGDRRLDEAAVVAAHDRDAVAFADAGLPQAPGERVGALLSLAEGERSALVDDRRPVGVADRGSEIGRRGGGPPAAKSRQRAHRLVRARGREHARAKQGRGDLQLVASLARVHRLSVPNALKAAAPALSRPRPVRPFPAVARGRAGPRR